MVSVPERLAILETSMEHQNTRIEYYGTLLEELHTHFLKAEGAKEHRKDTAATRHMVAVGVSAVVSAFIAIAARFAPHADAFSK